VSAPTTSTETKAPKRKVKRHPIRSAVFGLIAGIGAALMLVLYGILTLGTIWPIIVLVGVTVLGALWGMYGPRRKRKARRKAAKARRKADKKANKKAAKVNTPTSEATPSSSPEPPATPS
jgi:hypothetical protein